MIDVDRKRTPGCIKGLGSRVCYHDLRVGGGFLVPKFWNTGNLGTLSGKLCGLECLGFRGL